MAEVVTDHSYESIWTHLSTVPHRLGWVDVDGVPTRYLEAGEPGRPVAVLLHGTAGSLENFTANYGHLARTHHVFGIDMLGCGYTGKPDCDYLIPDYVQHVLGFLDVQAIGRALFVGVSLGSWITARLAHTAPERVVAAVLVAPAGILTDPDREAAFAAGVRQRRTAAAAALTWASVRTAMSGLVLDPARLIDDLIGVRLAIYWQPAMAQAMPHLLAFTQGDGHLSETEWRALDTPLLVVAAPDAPNMFLDNALAIARLAPRAELVEIRGADHWAQWEQPDAFHTAVDQFLARISKLPGLTARAEDNDDDRPTWPSSGLRWR